MRELCSLRNCDHVNIVTLIDCTCSASTMSLIMEYVPYSLKQIIPIKGRNNEMTIVFFFRQLLHALAYLHKYNLMHRDIKPGNVLITASNVIKLADFGQACLYHPDQPERQYEEQVGTRWYRAPELLFSHLQYSPSIDWWSAGCVLVEMINGQPPFTGRSDLEQISCMFQRLGTPTDRSWPEFASYPDASKISFDYIAAPRDLRSIVPRASPPLRSLLSSMLCLSPSRRKSPSLLLKHRLLISAPRSIDYRIQTSAAGPHDDQNMLTLDSIFADMSL